MKSKMKSFCISKQAVWDSYLKVKRNQGAAGVDHQSIANFEEDLKQIEGMFVELLEKKSTNIQ